MGRKTTVIIVVVVLILILAGVVGYGFYNGSKIRNYAKSAKQIMTDSNSKWTQGKLDQSNLTSDEINVWAKLVKDDSGNQLAKLNSLKAPRKAKDLESKSKEYFTIAQDASTNAISFIDYAKILEESSNNMKNFGGSSSGVDEFISLFTGIHEKLSASLTKLKAATPPPSFKEFNDKYITLLDRLDKDVVKALDYAKANQMNMLETIMPDFDATMKEFANLNPPSEANATEKILTDENKAKLQSYPNEVKAEADKLSKTTFSF